MYHHGEAGGSEAGNGGNGGAVHEVACLSCSLDHSENNVKNWGGENLLYNQSCVSGKTHEPA